jgi:hypothetical protein
MNIVALFLPNPKQFINAGLVIGATEGHNGELLLQVIAVHHAEFFHRVGRCAVFPAGANLSIRIPYAVLQDIQASIPVNNVCLAHFVPSLLILWKLYCLFGEISTRFHSFSQAKPLKLPPNFVILAGIESQKKD